MTTKISWTSETWNPVVGCEAVSEGCDHCYAKTLHDQRHKAFLAGKKMLPQYAVPFDVVQLMPDRLTNPMHWKEPRRVFVNSVSDLFHKDVPLEFLDRCFAVMAYCRRHTFQILTKRPARMRAYMAAWANVASDRALQDRWDVARRWLRDQLTPGSGIIRNNLREARARKVRAQQEYIGVIMADTWADGRVPLNIWLGTSVEHQAAADIRVPQLLQTPAAVRFLSCEPLLGPVDLQKYLWRPMGLSEIPGHALNDGCSEGIATRNLLHWVIVGGESGAPRRDMDIAWLREIVGQCRNAGIAAFTKQDSAWKSEQRGRIPDDLWVREYPAAVGA